MTKQLSRDTVQRAVDSGFKDGCAECGSRKLVVREDEFNYGVAFDVTCQDCGYKQEMTIMPSKR